MPKSGSITLVKEFSYRGQPEQWSNTYDFTGTLPANDTAWRNLAQVWHDAERACYMSNHRLVAAYGYGPSGVASVYQGDFRLGPNALQTGTYQRSASGLAWAGDQAGWIRGHIGTSIRGKKVYVRKYFHGGSSSPADADVIEAQWRQNVMEYGQILKGGTLPGGATWCSPSGGPIGLTFVSPHVTTRTLKRRGKRPTAP